MSTTGDSLIPYQEMMERALRSLVREALDLVGTEGLPGNHHFYISFRTQADGVDMPAHLQARYPDEMTIVLQHQFWGLETDDAGFSVTLSFGGRSERLRIPFEALNAFMDPAVNFGLQFHRLEAGAEAGDGAAQHMPATPDNETEAGPSAVAPETGGKDEASATVVTLDTFRKK